jgi:hypothetical protein
MHLCTAQSGPIFFFLDFTRALRHHAPIPPRKARTAHLEVTCRPPNVLDSNVPGRRISRRRCRDKPKMKGAKSLYIALFTVSLLVAGNVSVRAKRSNNPVIRPRVTRARPQHHGRKMPMTRARQRKTVQRSPRHQPRQLLPSATPPAAPSGALGSTAPASKPTSAQQQTPRVNSAGMVWVNTDSGVYHKPGTRRYGKTKQGKYMPEADGQNPGYRAAAPKKKSN